MMNRVKLNKDDLRDLNADDCRHPHQSCAECIKAGRLWRRFGHEEAVKHLVLTTHLLPVPNESRLSPELDEQEKTSE